MQIASSGGGQDMHHEFKHQKMNALMTDSTCAEFVSSFGHSPSSNEQGGYTMVELIMVMVIVGVLAAVAIPRLGDDTFAMRASADQIKAALRYAQKAAIASHADVTVNISTGTEDCGTAVVAGVLNCVVKSNVAAFAVTFNFEGRPTPNGAMVTVGTNSITIEAETGYVH